MRYFVNLYSLFLDWCCMWYGHEPVEMRTGSGTPEKWCRTCGRQLNEEESELLAARYGNWVTPQANPSGQPGADSVR